jgi:Uma2 family endonuclease
VAPAKKPATYADIEALPEHLTGEIIDGELFVSPRPSPLHARAEGEIHADLRDPFDRGHGGPGGWWLLIEPELHLDGNVMVPDIAGWRRERMPEFPRDAAVAIAPDWVCEVLSPSTMYLDRRWRTKGVVFGGLFGGHTRARIPPFQAVEVDMTGWWPPFPGGVAEAPMAWATAAITEP